MSSWLDALCNQHVRDLQPYESARRLFSSDGAGTGENSQIWLNANEAPEAEKIEIDSSLFNRYPDCQPPELIKAYVDYCGLAALNAAAEDANHARVIATRGADEGIELIIRGFCEAAKSSVLICPPTYGMYAISAQTFNVGVHKAPLKADFSLDIEAMSDYVGKVKVVFLCSPNNPTGTRIAQNDIIRVLELFKDKALVVLDEAYIEFDSAHAQIGLLKSYENLIILRTLSKAFALAGIRCGFLISRAAICDILMKVIAPYPVPAPVAQVARLALTSEGLSRMQERVQQLQSGIKFITERLKAICELEIVGDTKANFVLFRSAHNPKLMKYLVANGVIIRDQSKQLNLQNCLRITVGTPTQNARLIALIEKFFKQLSERNAS
uniref:histidinol-phosphate transaminase n=1 Tax=Ningiella ruwaisensis TaxID=2364274 RepID=UPI0010A09D98|nr:histidinol-phosphate transaminase [Ningiella ruwaisensis]